MFREPTLYGLRTMWTQGDMLGMLNALQVANALHNVPKGRLYVHSYLVTESAKHRNAHVVVHSCAYCTLCTSVTR